MTALFLLSRLHVYIDLTDCTLVSTLLTWISQIWLRVVRGLRGRQRSVCWLSFCLSVSISSVSSSHGDNIGLIHCSKITSLSIISNSWHFSHEEWNSLQLLHPSNKFYKKLFFPLSCCSLSVGVEGREDWATLGLPTVVPACQRVETPCTLHYQDLSLPRTDVLTAYSAGQHNLGLTLTSHLL